MTFGAMYQFTENFVQAFSHDEVSWKRIVGKQNESYLRGRPIANLRALFALQWFWLGKRLCLWDVNSGNGLNGILKTNWIGHCWISNHQGLKQLITDLNKLYGARNLGCSDHQSGKFRWIDCNDRDRQTLSFLKFGHYPTDTLLIACNFSDHLQHRNGVPACRHLGVLLDSDSPAYQGRELGVAQD